MGNAQLAKIKKAVEAKRKSPVMTAAKGAPRGTVPARGPAEPGQTSSKDMGPA